jgi:cytochrome c oxidase cbb3-type subunit III
MVQADGGGPGYPTLADDDWLWGGSLEDIRYTINHGVRNETDDARFSQMPAYGRDGLLTKAEISDLTEYVIHLSGGDADMAAVARATPNFEMNCVSCHGMDGKGDRMQGAPNLTDAVWLYGGTREEINTQIVMGRGGVMQPWQDRLDEPTIMALSVYVHTLGGGE